MEQFGEKKIVDLQDALMISHQAHLANKKIVLAGGCFDILHVGHILFLEKAKSHGDVLFVLLESDEQIRELKGEGRPINSQSNRALVLAALSVVEIVVLLPKHMDNTAYDTLISGIKPAIIATTSGDPYRQHKERQAALIGGAVIDVTPRLPEHSTSTMVTKLEAV